MWKLTCAAYGRPSVLNRNNTFCTFNEKRNIKKGILTNIIICCLKIETTNTKFGETGYGHIGVDITGSSAIFICGSR